MKRKPKRLAGWLPDDSKSDREAVEGIRFLQIPLLAWTLAILCLPLEVGFFWGTWKPWRQICFSLGALVYPLWIGIDGWVPWKMAMLRTIGGIDPERWERNPTAVAVADFVQTPRLQWNTAAIGATGALNPWLITAVSAAVGGRPLTDPKWLTASAALIFGLMDGLRGGALAITWLIRQIRRKWTSLREGSNPKSAEIQPTEDAGTSPPSSLGEFLEQRKVSKSTAISWYVIGLVIVGSLAFARGCLRRYGYLP